MLEMLEGRRLLAVWADFNSDGFSDLAVGVSGEDVNGVADAGAVNVIYGTAGGLASAGNEIWHLDSPGLLGDPGEYDSFGSALAAGDFDGDGYDDLAISAPYAEIGGAPAGAVWTLYGTPSGLTSTGSERLHQDNPRVRDLAELGDQFGAALASDDFNNDGYDDLAVGIPYEDVPGAIDAGAVHIFYGVHVGLSAPGNQFIHQDTGNVPTAAEDGDHFGFAVTTGDMNGDGFADLIVGVPSEDIDGMENAGQIHAIYGSGNGLATFGSQWWRQTTFEAHDYFGYSLAAGSFNNDSYDDLMVGSPGEDVGSVPDAGMVTAQYGSASGLTSVGSANWTQSDLGGSTEEELDWFGWTLAAGDFGGDGDDDVAIGTPFEDIGATVDAGSVSVLYSPFGIAGTQYWVQGGGLGNGTVSETSDLFGYTLAVGNFDGDAFEDLAIGTPQKTVGAAFRTGTVNVLYGQAGGGGGLGSAGSQLWHQDSPGIDGVAEDWDGFGGAVSGGKSHDSSYDLRREFNTNSNANLPSREELMESMAHGSTTSGFDTMISRAPPRRIPTPNVVDDLFSAIAGGLLDVA